MRSADQRFSPPQGDNDHPIEFVFFSSSFFFFFDFSVLSSSQVSTHGLVIPRFTNEASALFTLITELRRRPHIIIYRERHASKVKFTLFEVGTKIAVR